MKKIQSLIISISLIWNGGTFQIAQAAQLEHLASNHSMLSKKIDSWYHGLPTNKKIKVLNRNIKRLARLERRSDRDPFFLTKLLDRMIENRILERAEAATQDEQMAEEREILKDLSFTESDTVNNHDILKTVDPQSLKTLIQKSKKTLQEELSRLQGGRSIASIGSIVSGSILIALGLGIATWGIYLTVTSQAASGLTLLLGLAAGAGLCAWGVSTFLNAD